MSAASVEMKRDIQYVEPRREETGSWRVVQGVLTLVVLGIAAYYNTVGWKSPTVTRHNPLSIENTGFLVLLGLVWIMSPTAWVIARATFHETVRKRVLNVILIIGMLMVGSSVVFSWMNPGEEEKFIRDFGLGSILLIGIIIAIVMASLMIPQEVERKTVFTILSKPVQRFQYVLGKFVGTCLTLISNLSILGLVFCALYVLAIKKRGTTGVDLPFDSFKNVQAIIMIFFQVSVVAAVSIMVSILSTSNIFTIACGFFVFLAGQMSESWRHIQEHSSPVTEKIITIVYYVLPRLDNFDVREKLIVDDPIYFNYMWHAVSGGLVYIAAVLALAYLFFNDREF